MTFLRCVAHVTAEMASLDYKDDARDLHAFKELRFFLSHNVPLEIRCSVSRLELPLVADYLVGVSNSTISPIGAHQQHGSVEINYGGRSIRGDDSTPEDMDMIVKRIMAEPELVATCQVFSDGQPMHAVPMR